MSAPFNKPSNSLNPYNNRFRHWYEAIADWLLANPGGTQNECARALKRSVGTVSLIMNSDAFKAYYAQRREDFNRLHHDRLSAKLTTLGEKSVDVLLEKLEAKRDRIPFGELVKLSESALSRLGYGAGAPQAPTVQVNVQQNNQSTISPEDLHSARALLRAAEAARQLEGALGSGAPELEAEEVPSALIPPKPEPLP